MNTVSNAAYTMNMGYDTWFYLNDWKKVFRIEHLIGRLFTIYFDSSLSLYYFAYGDEFVYNDYPLGD